MKAINYSELRVNLKKYLDLAENENEKIIIVRDNKRKPCILISLEEYELLCQNKKTD